MSDTATLPAPKTGFLSRRIFNIPIIYLLGIVVLGLAYWAWRMKPADSGEVAAELAGEEGQDPALVEQDTADFGFQANPVPTYPSGLATTTTVDTNASWMKRGVEWAGLTGIASPGNAQLALQRYLNGEDLTFDEGRIRDAVIRQFGAPPEEITVGTTGSEPAKRQGTPPTTHTVKGPNDNTYGKLCRLYYGNDHPQTVDLLQAANITKLGPGGPFPVGARATIPAYRTPKYFTTTKITNTLSEVAAKNGTSVTVLRVLNAGMSNTPKVGTRVRVA